MIIQPRELEDFLRRILQGMGSNADEAAVVAEHLVEANLRGHDSHGAFIVDFYKNCLDAGALQPNAELTRLRGNGGSFQGEGSFLWFDGNRGYGQRLAREALAEAIVVAGGTGVAVMGLRNSHHIGRAGAYAEQAAAAGLISLIFINTLEFPPRVTPFGGKEPRLMTNPIAFGAPRRHGAPLILDFATSAVALGKVEVARNKGLRLPPGSIVDGQGRATTDPNDLFGNDARGNSPGAILPFGGHKGYGLLLFCELLAGALTGGDTARTIDRQTQGCRNNMLVALINPEYLGAAAYAEEMQRYLDYITATAPADPDFPVMLPGDVELRTLARRSSEGIRFDDRSWNGVLRVADSVGVSR